MISIIREFDSWYEFVTSAADPSLRRYKRIRNSKTGSENFTATKSFEEAVDMALRTGWPEGRKFLSDSLAIVAPRPEPYKSLEYEVAGMFPIVPIYASGDPACMANWGDSTVQSRPVVRIDLSMAISASVKTDEIMLRGAAALSLADRLENQGYSTELRVTANMKSYNGATLKIAVTYKKAGSPLDLDSAAFALAHPSTLRRLMFAIYEQHAELENAMGPSYGYPVHEPLDPAAIYISAVHHLQRETPETARAAVEKAAQNFSFH